MNKRLVILSMVLLVFLLGVQTPQFAQDASSDPERPDVERRATMLGFVRTINTAEVVELSTYGSFASWQTLLAHQQQYLNEWLARFYSEHSKGHFGDMPEILPRLSLRLNVHTDGKGYDVRLQDLTDKTCWYAALSDESGVIRQSKAIDCKM